MRQGESLVISPVESFFNLSLIPFIADFQAEASVGLPRAECAHGRASLLVPDLQRIIRLSGTLQEACRDAHGNQAVGVRDLRKDVFVERKPRQPPLYSQQPKA